MATADALRQRRHRAHVRGDHSLCDPVHCGAVSHGTPAVTPPVTSAPETPEPVTPPGLGARGRRLWRTVTAEQAPTAIEAVLLEEACRIADRLDRLDAFLRGESREWIHLRIPPAGDGSTVRVVVTGALSEARQQAVALKQIVADLRQAKAGQPVPQQGVSRRDELARRREERRKAAGL